MIVNILYCGEIWSCSDN